MQREAFTALLARQTDLEQRHTAWCEEINYGGEDTFYTRGQRDKVYAELVAVQEQIEAELEAERAAESAAETATQEDGK